MNSTELFSISGTAAKNDGKRQRMLVSDGSIAKHKMKNTTSKAANCTSFGCLAKLFIGQTPVA
jgi:hypothetical protein